MRTLVFLVVFGFLFVAGFVMVESSQPVIKFAINGTRFLMDENGSIGIGTDTPVGALAVNGTTNLTGRAYYNGSEICTAANALCTGVQAESDPLWSANSSSVARNGTCAAGYVVQNTTTTGVQCVPDQTSAVSGFGNMSQWRLDADTGTTATVLNNSLVQIVSGTGISTSIVGLDVFIENTGDTNAADDFSGAWSALSGKPAGFADDVDNDTTYTNGTGILLNGNQFNVSRAYLDTIYAPISVTGDNTSWNESRGNAIYLGISATAANSLLFGSQNTAYYLNTTGGTYDNRTFNQTLTDSLYYPRNTNPQVYYNSSTLPPYPTADNTSWNESRARAIALLNNGTLNNGNWCIWNSNKLDCTVTPVTDTNSGYTQWRYNTSGNATTNAVTNNTLVPFRAGSGITVTHNDGGITIASTVTDTDTNNGGVSNYTDFRSLNNSVVWNTNGSTANASINLSFLTANCALITGSAGLCDGDDGGGGGGDNASWNQSYAETLFYPLNTNPLVYYNSSTLPSSLDNYQWLLANETHTLTITNNTRINITAGADITITRYGSGPYNLNISHNDTSSQASSDNSGRTYIQDILLDRFGHITSIVTAAETVTDTNNGGVSNYTDFRSLNNSVVWNTNGSTANASVNVSYLDTIFYLDTNPSSYITDGNTNWDNSYLFIANGTRANLTSLNASIVNTSTLFAGSVNFTTSIISEGLNLYFTTQRAGDAVVNTTILRNSTVHNVTYLYVNTSSSPSLRANSTCTIINSPGGTSQLVVCD